MRTELRKVLSVLLLLLLLSFSLGIFLFDRNLLVYKKVIQDKEAVYSNVQNLIPLLKNMAVCFFCVILLTFVLGFFLKQKKQKSFIDCLSRQIFTFVPLVFLCFGRYFDGKAITYIFLVPLFPLFVGLTIALVLHFNLILHLNFNALRLGWHSLQESYRRKNRLFVAASVLLLMILMIHTLVNKPHFQRFSDHMIFTGDEPKYIRMTHSLATDGDFDVSDELVIEEGLEEARKRILDAGSRRFGHLSVIGNDGGIYHMHLPGISLMLLPGFLLDLTFYPREPDDLPYYLRLEGFPKKLYYTSLWMLTMAVLTFFLLARLIYRFFRSFFLLVVLLILFIYSSPFPDFVFQLYPELVASLLTLLVLNAILFPFKKDWVNFLSIALGIGFLPWLHQRFIILGFGLFLAFLIKEVFFAKSYKKAGIVTLLLFIAALPYLYYFYFITGIPLPNSMHLLYGKSFMRLEKFPLGFFGHLFDSRVGMIWIFPWTVLSLMGIYWGLKSERKKTLLLLLVFFPYYLLTCFHISWHGVTKEPGRFLVAVFPILLFLLAFTLIELVKKPTYLLFAISFVFLMFAFLNEKFWFFFFRFGGQGVTLTHLVPIALCTSFISLLFICVFLSAKFKEEKFNLVPLPKISRALTMRLEKVKKAPPLRGMRKSFVYSLLLIPLAYGLLFIKSWNDPSLSLSIFPALSKIKTIKDIQLIKKGYPSVLLKKSDKAFRGLFSSVADFRMDRFQKPEEIPLGTRFFYEKIPFGCYRVILETENSIPENTKILLQFMGEKTVIRFKSNPRKASLVFSLFKDRFISPTLSMSLITREPKGISGKLGFDPLPCALYGKKLILRPMPSPNPKTIRKKGKNRYRLELTAVSNDTKKTYTLLLHTYRNPHKIEREHESLVASLDMKFRKKKRPRRIALEFQLPEGFVQEKRGLALFIQTSDNRHLECKSLWLTTYDSRCIVFEKGKDF